jgi:hypothetical protein
MTMSDERRSGEDWDRSQWPAEGSAPDAPPAATWDREQMETDDPDDTARGAEETRDPAVADDAGPLSGGGTPSGEGHWERVDED